ncbi:hypothetical protein [Paracoccus beibuensis]|nr:hypothetical protein [Paracoccus beibuensis]
MTDARAAHPVPDAHRQRFIAQISIMQPGQAKVTDMAPRKA